MARLVDFKVMWTGVKKTQGTLDGKLIKANRKRMRAKIKGLMSVDVYSTHLERTSMAHVPAASLPTKYVYLV